MNSLETITFPASVKYIQDYTFSSDPALTTIIFKGTTAPSFSGSNMFAETTVKGNITIVVPDDASISAYQNALASYDVSSFKEIVTEEAYYTNLYGAEYYKDLTTLRNAINSGIGFVSGIKDDASLAAAKALLAGTPTPVELQDAVDNYVISLKDDGLYYIISQFDGFRSLGNGANAQNYDGKEAAMGYSIKDGVAGSLANNVSWVVQKRDEPDKNVIWKIIKTGDNYKLQNVGAGKYVGAVENDNKIGWTDDFEVAQAITSTGDGNFTIANATSPNTTTWKISGGFHNNSADLLLANTEVNGWSSTDGTERLWKIYELSDAQLEALCLSLETELSLHIGAGAGVVLGMKDGASLAEAQALLTSTATFEELENALNNVLPFTSGFYRLKYPKDNSGNTGNPYVYFSNDMKLTANLTEEEAKKDYSTVWNVNVLSNTYTYINSKGYEITMCSQGDYYPYYNSSNSVQKEVIQDANMKAHVIQPIGGFKDGSLGALAIDVTQDTGDYTKHFLRRRSANAIKADYVSSNPVPNGHQAYFVPATDITIPMNAVESNYWATLYVPFGVTLPTGTEAYVGVIDGDVLRLTSIGQEVPAATPVVLCGDAASVTAAITDGIAAYTGTNALSGQYLAASSRNDNIRSLGKKDGKIGFYKLPTTSTGLGANKAFLDMSSPSNEFRIVFDDDDVTGIDNVQSSMANGQWYDLFGRKVAAPVKGGLYVKDGKVVKF